ncbi:MAG: hypothetical protein CMK59_05555 [Proteobacteria bacterium]|nr:hypothetical protein [Pseudomonadota bacterium]
MNIFALIALSFPTLAGPLSEARHPVNSGSDASHSVFSTQNAQDEPDTDSKDKKSKNKKKDKNKNKKATSETESSTEVDSSQDQNSRPQAPQLAQQKTKINIPKGYLILTSPVPSDVYIDHKIVGKTPLNLPLDIGEHSVRISTRGYTPFVRKVVIEPGQSLELQADMSANEGSVEFQSPAPGAKVILDRKPAAILPIRLTDVTTGTHRYVITAPGHEPYKGTFSFSNGQNLYFYSELESSAGLASITSRPEGSSVYFNTIEEEVGLTPLKLESLEPAPYKVLIRQRGYSSVIREMDTSLGDKGDLKAKLPKKGGRIHFKTNLSNAEVYVHGFMIGKGKRVRTPSLEKGLYELEIRADNMKPATTSLNIENGESYRFKTTLSEKDGGVPSNITEVPPLTARWYFWAGIGGAAVAGGTSSFLLYKSLQPEPQESGDVPVTLP